MSELKTKLPSLYRRFLPDFIEKEFPEEKWATCHHCNLCQSQKSPYINTKCCAYYPHLANYLVGGILQDSRSDFNEGKKRVKQLIEKKLGITPYGIIPPSGYTAAKAKSNQSEREGAMSKEENDALLCPFFDRGGCTIWDYRENLCSTHFCISVGGNTGKEFWDKTNDYLKMAENSLSMYALHQIGYDPSKLFTDNIKKQKFSLEKADGTLNKEVYQNIWGDWDGREEEFYVHCYEVVAKLDQYEFEKITGYKQVILADALNQLLDQFNKDRIPDLLVINPNSTINTINNNEILLILNDCQEPITLIARSYFLKFNGQNTTKEVIDLGFKIILNLESLIENWYRKGFLVSPDSIK